MHPKPLLRSLALAFLAAIAPALLPAAPASPVAVTAHASLVSQYMYRGLRLNGPGFQPTVEAGASNFALGVWANFPIDKKVPDSADPEVDVYGWYAFDLGHGWSLTPGFTWYNYPRAPREAGLYRRTFEPSLALSYTTAGLRITPKFCYDVVREGPLFEVTALYAYPLGRLGTELDFTATAGTYRFDRYLDDQPSIRGRLPATKAWGDYWLLGVAMPFQIAANQKVTFGLAYTEGRDAFLKHGFAARVANPLALGRGVASVSYAFTF